MNNIDTSSWKEFKLSELFESESGDFDIKKEHINGFGVDVVTAGETNNGVLGKSNIDAKIIDGNTITIDMFGKCTYRNDCYKMVTHARVFSLKCLFDGFNETSGLYITTVLQKLVNGFSYSNMCSWNKIKDLSIKLPVKESEKIDWDYMQERIAELEQECIAELEQYLIATGLNDYELTDEDKEILATKLMDGGALQSSTSVNGCLKEARMFRVGDLFEKKTMKGYPKLKENLEPNEAGYHVYGQNIMWQHPQKVVMDKMYLHKVNPEHPILAYTSSVGEIGMIDESFYRSGDNGAFQGLLPKWDNNRYEAQYILSVLKKHFVDFGYSTSMANIVDLTFILPIQTDSQNNPIIDSAHTYHSQGFIPDWEYMEKYIKATEKIVIRDVVDWKDEMIEKTKEVVEGVK